VTPGAPGRARVPRLGSDAPGMARAGDGEVRLG